ncbi:YrzE family protein [Amedibacillus sp. YH-ame6]
MKNKVQIYVQSIAIVLILTMLFSLVFASLYYFNVIQTNTFHILNWISGILAFGAGGFWIGKCIEKKALFNAFLVLLAVCIPALLLCEHTLLGYIEVLSKLLSYMAVCLFIYTTKHKS